VKRPPWHDELLAVAALPAADQVQWDTDPWVVGVVVFAGAEAWRAARRARAEMLEAEAREAATWSRVAALLDVPAPARLVRRRWGITAAPPGESPWSYDWRVLMNQSVLIYLVDDDRALLQDLARALLAAGARRVFGVDGRAERPRPVIAEYRATRKAA
jgi:hypothetical protein